MVMFVLAAPAEAQGRPVDDTAYLHPHMSVKLASGRHLDLFCIGRGKPTVLFMAGLGDDMTTWRRVQPVVGRSTRSCAYDRAGYGFSEPSHHAADADSAAEDLQALIKASSIRTPILVVAHSLGALFAVRFAERHPDEVAGLVLVEPAFAGQQRTLSVDASLSERQSIAAKETATMRQLADCLDLLKQGAPVAARSAVCPTGPDAAEPTLQAELRRRWRNAQTVRAVRDEYATGVVGGVDRRTVDDNELDHTKLDLGSKPVIVLTAIERPPQPGLSPAQQRIHDAAWHAGHVALARSSSNGTNIDVTGAGHFIQLDRPDVVVQAVTDALREIGVATSGR